jgi:hypothetical protein
MGMSGVIVRSRRPSGLRSPKIWDEDWTEGETLVTLVLAGQEGTTMVAQTVLKTGMEKGMALSYGRLERLLASMPNR